MEHTKSTWSIDPDHSEIQFKVKHLAISNIAGTFKIFKGDVISPNEDFDNAEISLEIDTDSIDTNHEIRDGHLKTEEFFNTPQFPQITFSGLLQKQSGKYELTGNLTIRQNTLPIVLDVEFTGTGKGRNGDTRAGFEVNGKINRKDYGLTWSMLTETGGLIIGEEIKLHFDIQLIKQ
ncbi:YceI family protein [Mucilaginibacter lappiensis]|uniref:Polyisoprenoid-binding protein YceI n=1 Tax=Mucilaginibacter lappiensis TaxID=354630 RepID=A0A841JNG5_9SPHI|nr:YceI family protein [Mucilaginibacter lappiensis]MBB6129451.1 polyisoprenoid-binding protein YceI [Mucilaginibacter lappiensis]